MKDFVQIHEQYRSNILSNLTFPLHLHAYVELVYAWQGECEVKIDGVDYRLTAGDMLIIFPNCVHSYGTCEEGKYFCAIFPAEAIPQYAETLKTTRPKNPFIPKAKITAPVKALLGVISQSGEQSSGIFSGVMSAILCEILPYTEIARGGIEGSTKRVLDFCLEHYRENICLLRVSESLKISQSRISHIFEENVGLSFRYYINYLRVLDACRMLLSTDDGVGEIALSCGFDSIRSFNRNFLYIIGETPKTYRKNALKNQNNIF